MELNHLTNKHQNGIQDDKPETNGNCHQNGEKEVEIMCTNLQAVCTLNVEIVCQSLKHITECSMFSSKENISPSK